ncbi:unnamed protein product [Peniophora sp. CBMAI 1063]|nr:unnamed protein product [Peniophora sp. CBMAI 1063]
MMLLVLITSVVRHSWNIGVALLCIWLCLENVICAVNAVSWSDNAQAKMYTWCDITSRLNTAVLVGLNIAPLLITRRLYLIANLRSIAPISRRAKLWDNVVEWTCGLIWPLVSAGPLYYVVQTARFEVIEGLGCFNDELSHSILAFVLAQVWTILPPLISVVIYYPKVIWTFYTQSREIDRFLGSSDAISRRTYMRVLAIASVDILLLLPMGLVSIALELHTNVRDLRSLSFYPGWNAVHSHWTVVQVPYTDIVSGGTYSIVSFYWEIWTTPAPAFVIFALFGLTSDARDSYRHMFFAIANYFRRPKAHSSARLEEGPGVAPSHSLSTGTSTPMTSNSSRVEPVHCDTAGASQECNRPHYAKSENASSLIRWLQDIRETA